MFSIYARNDPHNRTEYLADYRSDISSLPTSGARGTQEYGTKSANNICSPGSVCKVCEDGSVWILNNQNEWVEQPKESSSSSSSGGSSDGSSNTATDDEVTEALSDTFG